MDTDCTHNTDTRKLVREGTQQNQRVPAVLSPDAVPVDARSPAHDIVFAKDFAPALKHYISKKESSGDVLVEHGDWQTWFDSDTTVALAIAAIEDVDAYKTRVREWFAFLDSMANDDDPGALKDRFGYLYAAIGVLVTALHDLQQHLPDNTAFKDQITNLIKTRLSPAFKRLLDCHAGGMALGLVHDVVPMPELKVLRHPAAAFSEARNNATLLLAFDIVEGDIKPNTAAYGVPGASGPTPPSAVFTRINHCATHNQFTSVFEQFLGVYAQVAEAAQTELAKALDQRGGHAPHYTLFLAFVQLMIHARDASNTLTQRHLDFYYRTILGLQPRPAQPGQVHLLVELAKQATAFDFQPGRRFKAGKDATGQPVYFDNLADMVANKAVVTSRMCLYRHGDEPLQPNTTKDNGRLFASPIANSADGKGAPLPKSDPSWQPFFHKQYVDGQLRAIDMPVAEVGFAIASHYLFMAEGTRTITLTLHLRGSMPATDLADDIVCRLTTAKGWLQKKPTRFQPISNHRLQLEIKLDGGDPAVVPYASKVHGYRFDTTQPLLLVTLSQARSQSFAYASLQDLAIDSIELDLSVQGIKTLFAANDFGPIDLSKPFQPYGATPMTGSALVVGCTEAFQKSLTSLSLDMSWQVKPNAYADSSMPAVSIETLQRGRWYPLTQPRSRGKYKRAKLGHVDLRPDAKHHELGHVDLGSDVNSTTLEAPDYTTKQAYDTDSRHGYMRLVLNGDFGRDDYQRALLTWLGPPPYPSDDRGSQPEPPTVPIATSLTLSYKASTSIGLNSTSGKSCTNRLGQFFHVTPFGVAERHPCLGDHTPLSLLPAFQVELDGTGVPSQAEFYLGITALAPPQNLSLLFEVADGTANPLTRKPEHHIHWSYLANNRWQPFPQNTVIDGTTGLLDSGIISLAVPDDASADNHLLPAGQYWIRAAVAQASDAVCRLRLVAAQALQAVFVDQHNDPAFSATPLAAGSISKLTIPDASVKGISQPFPGFGGRGMEDADSFQQRISERLRHKDRAITLWDIEHLVLEAFPQIFKVKCLNHTEYEPGGCTCADADCKAGTGGIYRELAPGHITVVTLPNLHARPQHNPLKPYTSLRLLTEIRAFLRQRCSGLARLHVGNPQFEEIRVKFQVKLYDGFDKAFYVPQLQQAITRFLSPWAFGHSDMPSFGGTIHKSSLIHWIEEQSCVDYLTDFVLYHDTLQGQGSVDLEQVVGSRAISILVSAPAEMHQISVIEPETDTTTAAACGCPS